MGLAVLRLTAGGMATSAAPTATADAAGGLFGPNVTVFDGSWTTDDINSTLQAASHETEFSQARHQFFFAPGTYGSPQRRR